MVLPALYRASADGGRNGVLRPQSWYNRAGVERVMGFCTPVRIPGIHARGAGAGADAGPVGHPAVQILVLGHPGRAAHPLPGARDRPAEALEAVADRQGQSLDKWDDYTEAKEAMFFYTDTADAPWVIVKSNDKKRARLNCMRHFLSTIDYPNKDHDGGGRAGPADRGAGGAADGPDGPYPGGGPASRAAAGRASRARSAGPVQRGLFGGVCSTGPFSLAPFSQGGGPSPHWRWSHR